jgi:hypothetical protein
LDLLLAARLALESRSSRHLVILAFEHIAAELAAWMLWLPILAAVRRAPLRGIETTMGDRHRIIDYH